MTKIINLGNGIPLILESIPTAKSFSFGIACRVGAIDETIENEGISHFIEHMLFRGTKKRSSVEISEAIDRVGGEIDAFTSREVTMFYSTVLSKDAETCVDVLSDLVMNPVFHPEDIEKERAIILEEIIIQESSFESLVHELNIQNAYRNSAIDLSILGSLSTVIRMNQDDLLEYYQRHYIPENIFLSIAGNFNEEKIISKIEKLWSQMENRPRKKNSQHLDIVYKPQVIPKNTPHVHICVNATGTSYSDKDFVTLQIVSNILGAGTSSRLYREIRENRGLAYSVYSYISAFEKTGLFTSYIGTVRKNYKRAIDITLNEYFKLSTNLVTVDKLEKAKNQILASVLFDIENTRTEMFRNLNDYFAYGHTTNVNEIQQKIENISRKDILTFAKNNLNCNTTSFTALGDVA